MQLARQCRRLRLPQFGFDWSPSRPISTGRDWSPSRPISTGRSESSEGRWRPLTPALALGVAFAAGCAASELLRRHRQPATANAATNRLRPPDGVNHVADIVEQVSPAAVNIRVEGAGGLQSLLGVPSSQGSGFIIREDGLILTNAHVAGRYKGSLVVSLTDGRELPARLLAIDVESDMALVKVEARGLPAMTLGQSKRCRAGEWVIAIGSPLTLSNTVTFGILSNTARNLGTPSNIEYLQTDAAITFGNSGGPLVDMQGHAIGINTMKADAGISFAIPIDDAKNFVEQALSTSKRVISRPKAYLGVTILSLSPTIVRRVLPGQPETLAGVLVHTVHPDSPAHQAGLRAYDVIMAANSEPVKRVSDLNRLVLKSAGAAVTLDVLRDNRRITVKVIPEYRQ